MVSRPREDAFYVPADWGRHTQTWLLWPSEAMDLPAHTRDALRRGVLDLAVRIRAYEPVKLICPPDDKAVVMRDAGQGIQIVPIAQPITRLRTKGPTFLVDGKGGAAAVDWTTAPPAGGSFAHALLGQAEIRRFRANMAFSDDAFTTDGLGTMIALKPAVFGHPDNTDLGRLQAYSTFKDLLDIDRIIWVDEPLSSDQSGTDIYSLCRFTGEAHVLQTVTDSSSDPDFDRLWALRRRLTDAEDAHGRRLTVTPIKKSSGSGGPYTSYFPVNTAVFIPAYGTPEDTAARQTISSAFPYSKIEAVDAAPFLDAGLTLSCLALGQPARLLERSKATILPKSAYNRPVPDWEGVLDAYIAMVENDQKGS